MLSTKILNFLFLFSSLYLVISYMFFVDIIIILSSILVVFLVFFYFLYKNLLRGQKDSIDMIVEERLKEAQRTATYDELTSLPNKNLFLDRVDQHIKHAVRHEDTLSVVALEISNLDVINVKYSRALGDDYLKAITLKLLESVRDEDTVARIHGNDFSIVLHHTNRENITAIAVKIGRKLESLIRLDNIEILPEFHIGISMYSEDGTEADILLVNARNAMKEAKLTSKIFNFYENK